MPFLRTSRVALLLPCVFAFLAVPAPAAAEIALLGEPFLIEPPPAEPAGGFGVEWLPPGGTAAQPPGFLVTWTGEDPADGGSAVFRAFVPPTDGAPAERLSPVGVPEGLIALDLEVGVDRRSALVFTDAVSACYEGLLFGPALDPQASLQPRPSGRCSWPFGAALLADGRLVVIYETDRFSFSSHFGGQLFAPSGEPIGAPFPASFDEDVRYLREVVAAPGGFLVATFHPSAARDQFSGGPLVLQRFSAAGQPLGVPVQVRDAERLVSQLRLVPVSDGFVAVWTEIGTFSTGFHPRFYGRPLDPTGAPAGPVQPLLDELDPADLARVDAAPGPGDTVLLAWSRRAGAEVEMYAQLLTADLAPAGEGALIGTRAADGRGPELAAGPAGDALAVWREADGALLAQRLVAEGECTPSESVLCLQGGRFEVSVEWADFQGNSGAGRRVPVASDDSGLFWFFHPDNWEMLVKVIDGCPVNGHFWVFAAAATNVEYTLTVNDLLAHETRVFRNDLGDTARALTVTNAFPTCGAGAAGDSRP